MQKHISYTVLFCVVLAIFTPPNPSLADKEKSLVNVNDDEGEFVTLSVILVIVGLGLTVGGHLNNAQGEMVELDVAHRLKMAHSNVRMTVQRWTRVFESMERDMEFISKEKSPALWRKIQKVTSEYNSKGRAGAEQVLKEMAGLGHSERKESDAVLWQEIGKNGFKVTTHALGLIGPLVHTAMGVLGFVVQSVLAALSAYKYTQDKMRHYGDAEAAQLEGILQRVSDDVSFLSCTMLADYYTALETSSSVTTGNEELKAIAKRLSDNFQRAWQCNFCADFYKNNPAPVDDPDDHQVSFATGVEVVRGFSYPAMFGNHNELNPDSITKPPAHRGVQTDPYKSVTLRVSYEKDLTTNPPVVDVAVVHRDCKSPDTASEFEKTIQHFGFVKAKTDDLLSERSSTKCHDKFGAGDTNVGRDEKYELSYVMVKFDKHRTPLTEFEVIYGKSTPTPTGYERVPVGLSLPATRMSTSIGRLTGSYDKHMPFITFKRHERTMGCPHKSEADKDVCTTKKHRTQCVWLAVETMGPYEAGWKKGVELALANDENPKTPTADCRDESPFKSIDDYVKDPKEFTDGCKEAWMEVRHTILVSGTSPMNRARDPANYPVRVRTYGPSRTTRKATTK